jgi:hypothetical protein
MMLERREVHLERLGKTLTLLEMSGRRFYEHAKMRAERPDEYQAIVVIHHVVDEHDELVYSEADIPEIMGWPCKVLIDLIDSCFELSGLDRKSSGNSESSRGD